MILFVVRRSGVKPSVVKYFKIVNIITEVISVKTPNKQIILDVTFDILPVVSNFSVDIFVYTTYICNINNVIKILLNE